MSKNAETIPCSLKPNVAAQGGKMQSSVDSEWPLSEPLFVVLICGGYVAAALCFFFMFNNVSLHV
jgi:hypothetical protein